MAGLVRRTLLLALALALLAEGCMAEGVRFIVSADIDPIQYAEEDRGLWYGLSALMDAALLEGTLTSSNGAFDLHASLTLNGSTPDAHTLQVHLYGVDSHWGVASPLLGDTVLMLNNQALLEFGVKTNHHLSLPLQDLFLFYPYVHSSALDVVLQTALPVLACGSEIRHLPVETLTALAEDIAALAEDDRELRIWIEAIGMDTGADQALLALLQGLPDYIATTFPDGLTIMPTDNGILWQSGETTVLRLSIMDTTTTLTVELPQLLTFSGTLRNDVTFVTGSLHMASPLLNMDASFSLPAALPVTFPFYLTLDADGMLLGSEPLQLFWEGEAHGDILTIRQLLPDHSRTMMTITAVLTPFRPETLPAYTAQHISGVNVLSLTSDSLRELMLQIRQPLATGLFQLLIATPPRTCQALMDVLDDAGVIDLLTDALSGGYGY